MNLTELSFQATPEKGDVSAILLRPNQATHLYVMGHGAGAGMRHPFMENMSQELAQRGIATFRYQFPYMEKGKGMDSPKVRLATVRSAVMAAREAVPDLPMLLGGKSMGGRMASTAASEEALEGVKGLIFLGFPLHAPGKAGIARGEHLKAVNIPMLFIQGTRDKLAQMDLISEVVDGLGDHATMHIVEGGDHSFKVLKRSGRTEEEVMAEMGDAIAAWVKTV